MDKPPAYEGHPGYPQLPTAPGFAPPPVMVQPNMAPPPGTVTVISNATTFGDQPMNVVCGNCNQRVLSRITYENGSFTYLCAFGLALFVWCGCCLIPCCVDSCKDVHHYCPNCNAQLGIYKRL